MIQITTVYVRPTADNGDEAVQLIIHHWTKYIYRTNLTGSI